MIVQFCKAEKARFTCYWISKEEEQVILLLAQSLNAKEIAKALATSHRTIEGRVARIKRKLACSGSRQQLAQACRDYVSIQQHSGGTKMMYFKCNPI